MEAAGVKIGENGQSAGNEIKSSYFARILRDYTLYPSSVRDEDIVQFIIEKL